MPISAGTCIPRPMSHSTASALFSTTKRTRSSRPSPMAEKYFMASSTESSMPAAFWTDVPTPMMAWPHRAVDPPVVGPFSSTMTEAPASAAMSAADIPAPPPPTTTTSASSSHDVGMPDSVEAPSCALLGAQPHRSAPAATAAVAPDAFRKLRRETPFCCSCFPMMFPFPPMCRIAVVDDGSSVRKRPAKRITPFSRNVGFRWWATRDGSAGSGCGARSVAPTAKEHSPFLLARARSASSGT